MFQYFLDDFGNLETFVKIWTHIPPIFSRRAMAACFALALSLSVVSSDLSPAELDMTHECEGRIRGLWCDKPPEVYFLQNLG